MSRARRTDKDAPPLPLHHHAPARAGGQALDAPTQATMNARFGHDFSAVRVHTDARAEESTGALGADAYTLGDDIVFGARQYAPGSAGTERLLAHELTHVVQQDRFGPGDPSRVSDRTDASEREAESVAPRVRAGERVSVSAAPGAAVARAESGPGGPPDPNAVLEQAAHTLSYEQFKDGQRVNPHDPVKDPAAYQTEEQKHAFAVAMMQRAGYDVESTAQENGKSVTHTTNPTVTGEDGFAMRTFMPQRDENGQYRPGVSPVVGFRGTVPNIPSTLIDDLNPDGIGAGQFQWNRDLIAGQMAQAAQAGPVTVTGHSLGGALAQRTAAAFPEDVGGVTTFQSARVGHDVAGQFDANNAARQAQGEAPIVSHHIRTAADVVPWGGQDLTRGDVTTYGMSRGGEEVGGLGGLLPAHVAMPATGAASQNGSIPALTGADGTPVANPYAPGGDNPTFGAPHTTTTDADKADDWGVVERARRVVGLPVNMAYHGYNWGAARAGEAVSGIGGASVDAARWGATRATEAATGVGGAATDAAHWTATQTGAAVSGVGGAARDAAGWGMSRGGEAVRGVGGAGADAARWGEGRATEAAQGVGGFLRQASQWDSAGAAAAGLGGGARDAAAWTGRSATEAARGVGGALGDAAGWTAHTAVGAARGLGTAAGDAAAWTGHAAHDAAAGLGHAAGGALGWLGETGGQAAHGVAGAASQAAGWLGGAARGVGSGALQTASWLGSALW